MLAQVRPRLLILDTLARFSGVEENDNPSMTAFCGILEDLIADFGCNIILLHHSNKTAGDCVEDSQGLLYRVEAAGQVQAEGDTTADAYKLADEVRRREMAGEKPLAVTKGGYEAFSWGMPRSERAGKKAIELELLISIPKGRGNILGTSVLLGTATPSANKICNNDAWLSFGTGGLGTEGVVP